MGIHMRIITTHKFLRLPRALLLEVDSSFSAPSLRDQQESVISHYSGLQPYLLLNQKARAQQILIT